MLLEMMLSSCHNCGHKEDFTQSLEITHYKEKMYLLSFVCSLCMGYLSSQDFAQASMNWIAEGINVIGQGSLLGGVWMLHKAGLKDLEA